MTKAQIARRSSTDAQEGEILAPDRAAPPTAEPMKILTIPPAAPEPEQPAEDNRIELFSLNGKKYYIPKHVSPSITFAYLRDVRRQGTEYALGGVLEKLLGKDGLDALASYDGMTVEEMTALMSIVGDHVMAVLNTGK